MTTPASPSTTAALDALTLEQKASQIGRAHV